MDRFSGEPKDEEFIGYCGCGCGREIYRGDDIIKEPDGCRMFATDDCHLKFTGAERGVAE